MSPEARNENITATEPKSWNAYGYVNADPANSNDPSGEGLWSSIWRWILGEGERGFDNGGWGPAPSSFQPIKPPNTQFPQCNPNGNETTEKKLNFMSATYD